MYKIKVSIVSFIALVVFLSAPTQSLALSLKCPVNEYGIEQCNRSSYGEEDFKVESYTQEQGTAENQTVSTIVPTHHNLLLVLIVLVIVGLLIWFLFHMRRKKALGQSKINP